MAKAIKLTVNAIEALKAGTIADPQTPGLKIERLRSGKLMWQYKRRYPAKSPIGTVNALAGVYAQMVGGSYPSMSIAGARTWAADLNAQVEYGIDPRAAAQAAQAEAERLEAKAVEEARVSALTVNEVHRRYMEAVETNTHRVVRRKSKKVGMSERTKTDKQGLYDRNFEKIIGARPISTITNHDINRIIVGMSTRAPVQANRSACEINVFFKWVRSIRGRIVLDINLPDDPCVDLPELWNQEGERERWLDHDELPIWLEAVAGEPKRHHRRALLLLLLTGCRRSEITNCPTANVRNGMLIVTANRAKNGCEHPIQLGPWGWSLAQTNGEWLIMTNRGEADGPMLAGWDKVRERVRVRMEGIAGRPIEPWTLHDLRRTMRSHVDELVDSSITERMLNLTCSPKLYQS